MSQWVKIEGPVRRLETTAPDRTKRQIDRPSASPRVDEGAGVRRLVALDESGSPGGALRNDRQQERESRTSLGSGVIA
jgi:hypothetical protein